MSKIKYIKKEVEVKELQKDLGVKITPEMLVKRAGGQLNERMAGYLPKVIALGEGLLEPKTVHDVFTIDRIEDNVLYLENGEEFKSEPLCKMMSGADQLVVMCTTIGPVLEERVRELSNEGEFLESYLLDIYGATAVGVVRNSFYDRLVESFDGFGATVTLEPGQLDWNIRAQKAVFRLISPEKIGVSLNEGNMMTPIKTCTSVFGVGDVDKVKKGVIACAVCPRRKTCHYRHEAEEIMEGIY